MPTRNVGSFNASSEEYIRQRVILNFPAWTYLLIRFFFLVRSLVWFQPLLIDRTKNKSSQVESATRYRICSKTIQSLRFYLRAWGRGSKGRDKETIDILSERSKREGNTQWGQVKLSRVSRALTVSRTSFILKLSRTNAGEPLGLIKHRIRIMHVILYGRTSYSS